MGKGRQEQPLLKRGKLYILKDFIVIGSEPKVEYDAVRIPLLYIKKDLFDGNKHVPSLVPLSSDSSYKIFKRYKVHKHPILYVGQLNCPQFPLVFFFKFLFGESVYWMVDSSAYILVSAEDLNKTNII